MRKVYCLMLRILLALCLTVSVNAATLHLFEPALTATEVDENEPAVPT